VLSSLLNRWRNDASSQVSAMSPTRKTCLCFIVLCRARVEIVSRLLKQSQAISNLIDGRVHIK
jgi:hypothetical protein